MTDWCVLRMAPRSTMKLAESLAKDGFEVWTPIETLTMNVPRANVKREVRRPLMASYVFARAVHLIELLMLADMPVKPRRGPGLRDPAHADFSVMHFQGSIPMIAERHLASLRTLEAKKTPRKRAAYSFPRNAKARVKDGVFGGFSGIVGKSTEHKTKLAIEVFGKTTVIEIPTSLLEMDEIYSHPTVELKAA